MHTCTVAQTSTDIYYFLLFLDHASFCIVSHVAQWDLVINHKATQSI